MQFDGSRVNRKQEGNLNTPSGQRYVNASNILISL